MLTIFNCKVKRQMPSILKKNRIIILSLFVLMVSIGVLNDNEIVETIVEIDGTLNSVLAGKVVIHLSDLHIQEIGNREQDLIEKINDLQPDILFLTGDYVKWDGDYQVAMEFLSKLEAKIGIWAVMGDYDYSNIRNSCLFCHEAESENLSQVNKVKFLKNTGEIIQIDGKRLRIFGVDEVNLKNKAIKEILSELDHSIPLIVLSHNPLNFNFLDNSHEVLMLAGDTHGGQFPLPAWVWGELGYEKNKQFNYGLFRDKNKQMFVTRGIGTSHFPIRLFCAPEVVVFKF